MNSYLKVFLISNCFVGLVILFFLKSGFQNAFNRSNTVGIDILIENLTQKHNQTPKIVLIYTPLWGKLPWPGLTNWHFTHYRGKPCPVSNCVLTYNKKDLSRSDAVVFHARDVPDIKTMKQISHNRNRLEQRWVYFTHENPYFVHHDVTRYNYFFNWTMSYRSDSDIFLPYGSYERLNPEEAQKIQLINYAEGKDKLVAWAVYNCGRIRDKLVTKLMKYAKITIFGRCGKYFNQWNVCKQQSRQCSLKLQTFKFYLSFENAMCVDYVTEKYWSTPFEHKMVPIVLGSNYDDRTAIPGSYINVLDFPSLKALAGYLEYLDKNDTAYNEYFQWKTKYKFGNPNSWQCEMCANLHNDSLPKKIYRNLDIFWGKRPTCNRNPEKIKRLLKN